MKINKWTLGLAAVGVVSVASVASAEEKMSAVQTMLSGTTISGYVDTSAEIGTSGQNVPAYKFNSPSMNNGFNLDVVKLTIEKPLDEAEWAAGFKFDTLYGPWANQYNTESSPFSSDSDFAIQQAYVAMRTPVGNGLDFKMGVFNSIIGYETFDSGNDPNFTRSYGHTIEPQTMTGLLATYKFSEVFSAAAGIADTVGPAINRRGSSYYSPVKGGQAVASSYLTYMGSIALTAPESMGWFAGSTLYAGVVNGFNSNVANSGQMANQTSWYAGATMKTPVTGLRVGIAYDYLGWNAQELTDQQSGYANAIAGYLSYQATEKLSFHGRLEYATRSPYDMPYQFYAPGSTTAVFASKVVGGTVTVQYDLWQNVISRLEFRWDHAANGVNTYGGSEAIVAYPGGGSNYPANGEGLYKNNYLLALNVIYKF